MALLLFNGPTTDPNFFYHSHLDIDHSFLLIDGKKKTLFVSLMNEAIARSRFSGRGKIVIYADAMKTIAPFVRRKTVGIDASAMSASMAASLGKICHVQDRSGELSSMRRAKRPDEVSDIRRAVRITKEILDSLDVKGAKYESDLHKQLLMQTLERGLEPAFEPIVSTDGNTSYPHYHSSKKKIGSLVMIDYGVRYNHYCSDLTRCFILDQDRKKKEQYERLQDICFFITDSLPDLKCGKDAAKLALDLIAKAGFPKPIHSIGHGIGLEVHEYPRLGMKSEDPLAGAAMAIEPAFYLSRYGMRYEETVYNDGRKARVL